MIEKTVSIETFTDQLAKEAESAAIDRGSQYGKKNSTHDDIGLRFCTYLGGLWPGTE
jgi:hypothetical protein